MSDELVEVECQECHTVFLTTKPTGNGSDNVCPLCADLIVTEESEDDFEDYPLDRGD